MGGKQTNKLIIPRILVQINMVLQKFYRKAGYISMASEVLCEDSFKGQVENLKNKNLTGFFLHELYFGQNS